MVVYPDTASFLDVTRLLDLLHLLLQDVPRLQDVLPRQNLSLL